MRENHTMRLKWGSCTTLSRISITVYMFYISNKWHFLNLFYIDVDINIWPCFFSSFVEQWVTHQLWMIPNLFCICVYINRCQILGHGFFQHQWVQECNLINIFKIFYETHLNVSIHCSWIRVLCRIKASDHQQLRVSDIIFKIRSHATQYTDLIIIHIFIWDSFCHNALCWCKYKSVPFDTVLW